MYTTRASRLNKIRENFKIGVPPYNSILVEDAQTPLVHTQYNHPLYVWKNKNLAGFDMMPTLRRE